MPPPLHTISTCAEHPMNKAIANNLRTVRKQVEEHASKAGRKVQLLAVSKKHPALAVQTAHEAGQMHFGENYAQELASKHDELAPQLKGLAFHFIGHLQSNKARLVVGRAALIHTVDRMKILRTIDRLAKQMGRKQRVLFEVHLSKESTKSGCSPEQLPALLEAALSMDSVVPVGLMTMPPFFNQPEKTRPFFAHLRELRDEQSKRFGLNDFDQLSMGMSADFREAIDEGATIVRIGTSIFGSRS